jgi:hypothetical protein
LIQPGEAGSVSPGVTQRLALSEDGPREGKRYAIYTATSTQPGVGGWSAIGRQFDPPVDLSWHRGIGFWLRGDGHGGAFKLQLRDERGATDYYITNDFTGWRYQQLARPAKDPIDYSQVRSLTLYYNSLPGRATVVCGIDDVKALRSLDTAAIANPWIEIGGRRLSWHGELTAGQYLIRWPGEPVLRYGLPLKEPERAEVAEEFTLPAGVHAIKFGAGAALNLPVRVRLTQQPPERHALDSHL